MASASTQLTLVPANSEASQAPCKIKNIAELAELAGVAVSTVSRSLAGKSGVNSATRARIRELAQRHGFGINQAAQALRTGKGKQIGLLTNNAAAEPTVDPMTMRLLKTILDQAMRNGFSCVVHQKGVEGSTGEEEMGARSVSSANVGASSAQRISLDISVSGLGIGTQNNYEVVLSRG